MRLVDFQSSGLDYMTKIVDESAGELKRFDALCNSCLVNCYYNLIQVMCVLFDIF